MPFKVKLKFKLLFKCLRQLTMSAIYPKSDIIITHSKPSNTHTNTEIRRQYETLHAIRGNLKRASELPSSACWTCARPSPSWGSSSVPHPLALHCLWFMAGVWHWLWAGQVSIYGGHCTLAEKCISMPTALADSPGGHPASYLI